MLFEIPHKREMTAKIHRAETARSSYTYLIQLGSHLENVSTSSHFTNSICKPKCREDSARGQTRMARMESSLPWLPWYQICCANWKQIRSLPASLQGVLSRQKYIQGTTVRTFSYFPDNLHTTRAENVGQLFSRTNCCDRLGQLDPVLCCHLPIGLFPAKQSACLWAKVAGKRSPRIVLVLEL